MFYNDLFTHSNLKTDLIGKKVLNIIEKIFVGKFPMLQKILSIKNKFTKKYQSFLFFIQF